MGDEVVFGRCRRRSRRCRPRPTLQEEGCLPLVKAVAVHEAHLGGVVDGRVASGQDVS